MKVYTVALLRSAVLANFMNLLQEGNSKEPSTYLAQVEAADTEEAVCKAKSQAFKADRKDEPGLKKFFFPGDSFSPRKITEADYECLWIFEGMVKVARYGWETF